MLRIKELCKEYSISRPTMYRWLEMGLPHHKVGNIVLFDEEEVKEWIKGQDVK